MNSFQVELESLKKELTEKHTLLCQAVQAIELEEDDHKKSILKKDEQINDLCSQLKDLQQKYKVRLLISNLMNVNHKMLITQ